MGAAVIFDPQLLIYSLTTDASLALSVLVTQDACSTTYTGRHHALQVTAAGIPGFIDDDLTINSSGVSMTDIVH